MCWLPASGAIVMRMVDVRVGPMAHCVGLHEPLDRQADREVRERLLGLRLDHARVVVTDVLVTRPREPWTCLASTRRSSGTWS